MSRFAIWDMKKKTVHLRHPQGGKMIGENVSITRYQDHFMVGPERYCQSGEEMLAFHIYKLLTSLYSSSINV